MGAMHSRSSLILLVIVADSVMASQFMAASRNPTALLGQGVEQHYNCNRERPSQCSEGLKLTFGSANGPMPLAVDFVSSAKPQGSSNPPSTIELRVTLTTPRMPTTAPGLTLRIDRRPYPL